MGLLQELPLPENKTQKGWPWTREYKVPPKEENPNSPKISIVTPSYNQGQYLEETIRSVLLQNYPNLEYIIIDGGSTDNSVEIIKKYEPWLSRWESKPDKGQSEAINKGLTQSTGEIFNWLCSDDILLAQALHIVANYFQNKPDIACVHGQTVTFSDQSPDLNAADRDKQKTYSLDQYLANMVFPQPSAFFKQQLIKSFGGLNETLHYTMDYEMVLKILLGSNQTFLPVSDIISKYRIHSQSKTGSALPKFRAERFLVFSKLLRSLPFTEDLINHLKLLDLYHDGEDTFNVKPEVLSHNTLQKATARRLIPMGMFYYRNLHTLEAKQVFSTIKQLAPSIYKEEGLSVFHKRINLLGKKGLQWVRAYRP